MGGILATSFPANVFNATLRGLQRQVLGNAISVVAVASRGIIMIAALYILGAAPLIFFSAQLLLSALEVTVLGVVVWMLLPRAPARPQFDFRLFRANWRFSLTVWLSVLIGQLIILSDKVVMSKVLPLELFGLYSLAFAVASTVQRLATPFTNAYFPHFVELVEKGSHNLLSQAYYLATQLASAVVLSAGLLMLIYAKPVMLLITGNVASAETIAPVFAILVVASTLSSLTVLPQILQLACGAPWIALRINLFQAIPYVVLLALLAPHFGMYAPACLWLVAGVVNMPIMTGMTHRVALQGQAWAWFKRVILLPGSAAAAVLFAGAVLMPEPSPLAMLPWLAANYALALTAALLGAFRGKLHLVHPPRMG